MAAPEGRGLVSMSYGADSEISDSEDERISTGHTPPSLMVGSLGIPASQTRLRPSSPPSFEWPEVHAAPTITAGGGVNRLVDYGVEEDEEHAAHVEQEEEAEVFPPLSRQAAALPNRVNDDTPIIEISDMLSVEEGGLSPSSGVELPPEPAGSCPKALQDKVAATLEKKSRLGLDVNRDLQQLKDFRNPSIYEKLVHFCNIDEFGSSFPEHLPQPREWGEESSYQSLAKAQKCAYEKKEKAKLERTKVEFVTGTKRPIAASTAAAAGAEGQKKPRRSKWDVSADLSGGSSPRSAGRQGSGVGAMALAQARHISQELKSLEKK